MPKMVVCIFDSPFHAEAARRALLERGYASADPWIEHHEVPAPHKPAQHTQRRGLKGVIAGMFGDLPHDDELAQAQTAPVDTMVSLQVPDETAAARAVAILSETNGRLRGPMIANHPAAHTAVETPYGPDVHPLPNSPTGWHDATQGEKATLDSNRDPGRPSGLVRDAQGLGTDDAAPTNKPK